MLPFPESPTPFPIHIDNKVVLKLARFNDHGHKSGNLIVRAPIFRRLFHSTSGAIASLARGHRVREQRMTALGYRITR